MEVKRQIEEYDIVQISEKKAKFGIGKLGILARYEDDSCEALYQSLDYKGVGYFVKFPSFKIANLFLHRLDGKEEIRLVRSKQQKDMVYEEEEFEELEELEELIDPADLDDDFECEQEGCDLTEHHDHADPEPKEVTDPDVISPSSNEIVEE